LNLGHAPYSDVTKHAALHVKLDNANGTAWVCPKSNDEAVF